MISIHILNNNICELRGDTKVMRELFQIFQVKHPGAFFIQKRAKTRWAQEWDGMVKYITNKGTFRIGLLPAVYKHACEIDGSCDIIDHRMQLKAHAVIPNSLGELTLYPRQKKSLERLLFNKIGDIPFTVCAGDLAVGFGKSLLFCAVHEAYQRKLKTILLLNDSDLFNQFKREIPPMLPGESISFIQGQASKNPFGNFNVAMVQSLAKNLRQYANALAQIDICLIDEADIIDNKTYKTVIEHLYNSRIRIGLSGTLYMNNNNKNMIHNLNVMSFIGPKVDTVKLSDQMKTGKATPVTVKMIPVEETVRDSRDYQRQYHEAIVESEASWKKSWERVLYNAKYDRFPMLVVTKIIDHSWNLYHYYEEQNKKLKHPYRIARVDHTSSDRNQVLEKFRKGGIDILISTTIISRGKNFPALKYLQNTASMDSNEKSIQILGRLVRKHESKTKAYLDDLCFPGNYLSRHAKHRMKYYQNEHLRVIKVNH